MPNTKKGSITATWLPDKPADALAQSPNTIFSAGDLSNRIDVGFNNPCAIPGTVLLYDFTDKSTTLYDKSGFQRNAAGTSIDIALYEETPFGTGYNFPGAADYFSISEFNRIDEDLLTELTIEIIIKTEANTSTRYIVSKGSAGNVGYHVAVAIDRRIFFTFGNLAMVTSITVLNTDEYYHVACTYSSTDGAKLYINGMLEDEDSSTGAASANGATLYIGCYTGTSLYFEGMMTAVRISNRVLDPSKFIHHYYLRTLVDGRFGGSSVLFDESLSTFPKRKAVIVTVNWKKDTNSEWANFYIQTKKGSQGEIQVPDVDFKDVYSGGLPEVDKYTVGYWIFNGITASKDGSTGLVRDWSGNNHHATLVSLDNTDLVKTRFDKYYDLDGSNDYYQVPHHDQLNPEMQNFTIEMMVRNDYFNNAVNQDYFRKYSGGSEFFVQYRKSSSDTLRIFIEDDAAHSDSAVKATISNLIDKNGWYQIAATVNRVTNIMTLILDGTVVDEEDITTVTGPIGNTNTLQIGTGLVGSNRVDGPIAYIRYSIGIARNPDEIKLNAMNFNSRANGIIQDLLVE